MSVHRLMAKILLTAMLLVSFSAGARELEVVYLANEGYLLRAGGKSVLIDALVTEPAWNYAVLSPDVYADLLDGKGPFAQVDLVLVSHMHADHFQAGSTLAFLAAHPESIFHSSQQVAEIMQSVAADKPTVLPRIGATGLPDGLSLGMDLQGVNVQFFPLSHGSGRFANIENYAHLVTLGGYRVLHLGDAAMQRTNFTIFQFPEKKIDLAFIPYWYFAYPEGVAIYRNLIDARKTLATHIPPGELEKVSAFLRAEFPEVEVLGKSLDTLLMD